MNEEPKITSEVIINVEAFIACQVARIDKEYEQLLESHE